MTSFRWLIMLCLLSACRQGAGESPPPVFPELHAIEGRAEVADFTPDWVGYGPIEGLPGTLAPVRADGTFSLPLPDTVSTEPMTWTNPQCDGVVVVSNPGAQFREMTQLLARAGGRSTNVAASTTSPVESTAYVYVFATGATRIVGHQVCAQQDVVAYDMKVAKGWNLKRWTLSRSSAGLIERHEVVAPVPLVWTDHGR